MITVKAVGGTPIPIGKKGEGGVTRVGFDLTELIGNYGEGTAQLTAVRPGEEIAYAAVLTREENAAYWDIGREWTVYCGTGACQLSWYVGDALTKSEIFSFLVADSLETGEDAPAPSEEYFAQVQQFAVRAQEASLQAETFANAAGVSEGNAKTAAANAGIYAQTAESSALCAQEATKQAADRLGEVGDIETALDSILAIQAALIGGAEA